MLAMYDIARCAGDEAMGARPVGDEGVGARRVGDEGLIKIARRSGDEEVLIVLLAMGAHACDDC